MELTIKKQESERKKKVYELAKFSLKHLPENKTRTQVYEEIAKEFNYWNWRQVAKIYSELRKQDKFALPLKKDTEKK